MALRMEEAEFWLPPEFLTDDDIVMGKKGSGLGFGAVAEPKDLFPYDFESLGFSSDLGSPVESLVGSTETESDEDDFIAGLTWKFAHSTLEDEIPRRFPSDNNKAWGLSRSPQSTLCLPGKGCGCRRRNCQSRVSSPAAAFDLYGATTQEARMRMNETSGHFHARGLTGPSEKPNSLPVLAEPVNLSSGFHNTNPSLSYQKLRATQFQRLSQIQAMKQRQEQLDQNRARPIGTNRHRPSALLPSAWPSLQQARHQRQTGSGMRAVFLGDPAVKRECSGTGVFLPRPVNTTPTTNSETRSKKPALSTVLLPERVVQALNLKLEDSEIHRFIQPGFDHSNDQFYKVQYGNGLQSQNRSLRTEQAVPNEPMLPQDWSY